MRMDGVAAAWWIAGLVASLPWTAGARTVVTLSFDDAIESQAVVPAMLATYGMRASFFPVTDRVGTRGNLTWAEIQAIAAAGHEIGGHTLDHQRLTDLSSSEAQRVVCDDRAVLVAHGFDPVSFAYPFGASDARVEAIVAGCGYALARGHGGLYRPGGCTSCPPAESIPPANPLRLRAPQSVRNTDTLADLQGFVLRAEQAGGGWINFNFHEVLPDCAGDTYCVEIDLLEDFLAWLAPRAALGTVVLPQGEAFGSISPAPDTTPPTVSILAPAEGASVSGTVTLRASASDDVGVDRVDFLIGGVVLGSDATAPYELAWNTMGWPNADVAIAARAHDAAGNSATTTARTVTVANEVRDGTPPSIALIAPAAREILSGEVLLSADAGDDVGVVEVAFLVNGAVVGRDVAAPWEIAWASTDVPDGLASIAARARDAAGNVTTSAVHIVTVQNGKFDGAAVRVPFGSEWRYWSGVWGPGDDWAEPDYDDRRWPIARAQFGYGEGDEATWIPRGFIASASTYFRRTIEVPGVVRSARLHVLYDDGFLVFVNGVQVASEAVGSAAHFAWATAENENATAVVALPASAFAPGHNVIAVVVKQHAFTSDDLSFDLALDLEL